MVMVFGAEVKVKRFAFNNSLSTSNAFSAQQQHIMHTNYTNERKRSGLFLFTLHSSTAIMFRSKVILCDAMANGPKHNKHHDDVTRKRTRKRKSLVSAQKNQNHMLWTYTNENTHKVKNNKNFDLTNFAHGHFHIYERKKPHEIVSPKTIHQMKWEYQSFSSLCNFVDFLISDFSFDFLV